MAFVWIDVEADPYAWTSEACIHQLISSINEHIAVTNLPSDRLLDEPFVGDNIQSASFWNTMQRRVDSLILRYVNVIDWPGGFNNDPDIPLYTRATFTAALVSEGAMFTEWKASTDAETYDADINDWTNEADAMYAAGSVQCAAGHRIGPWLVKQLQEHLTWLTTTKSCHTSAGSQPYIYSRRGDGFDSICVLAEAEAVTDFDADSWVEDDFAYYKAQTWITDGDPNYTAETERVKSSAHETGIPTDDWHSAELYYFISSNRTYYDFDSLGVLEDRYYLHQSFPLERTDTRDGDEFVDTDVCPFDLIASQCPTPTSEKEALSTGLCWVFTWDFDGHYEWPGYSSSSSETSDNSTSSINSSSSSSSVNSSSSSSSVNSSSSSTT